MATSIIFKNKSELKLSACTNFQYTGSTRLTSHKIEEGAEVSDHGVNESPEISLQALISNISINGVGGPIAPELAFLEIENARESIEPVTIKTVERNYESYLIEKFSTNKSKETGKTLSFSLSLKKIRVAKTKTTKNDISKLKADQQRRNAAKVKKGKQQTKPLSSANIAKKNKLVAGIFKK